MIDLEINSNIRIKAEEILVAVNNLDTPELEAFFQQIAELLVQRKNTLPTVDESVLLSLIHEPALSAEEQATYHSLYHKLQIETINEAEYEALSVLMKKVEQKGVEKLKYLVELSKQKHKTVAELMEELGIESISNTIYV